MRDPVELVRELCEIPSASNDPAGVNRAQAVLARELVALGFRTELVPNPLNRAGVAPVSGDLLVATLRGESPRFVTFMSHVDTLDGATNAVRFRRDGQRLVGQGVLDDKASQVVALEGLRRYLARVKTPRLSLRFVSSPSEEAGSTGFHALFGKFGADSEVALGFEPALEDGSVVESRRGNRWYEINVRGFEAHSGRAPEKGANAALELAHQIVALHALNDPARGVTVSVGRIEGGADLFNVVCGWARAKVDTRFGDLRARDRLHARIEKILGRPRVRSKAGRRPTETCWELRDDCPPVAPTPESRALVRKYLRIVAELEGRRVKSVRSGGAADICHMARPGLLAIDGLGAVGGNMHREDEFVEISSLETRSEALARFLESL